MTLCTLGQYCPVGASMWMPCPAGKFCVNATIAQDCSAGRWSNSTGLIVTSQCTECAAGTYGSISGQTSAAIACPFNCTSGQYCPAGSPSSSPCPAGSYCTNSSTISQCPPGRWSGSNGLVSATSCTLCVAGTYGNVAGQTSVGAACPFTCAAGTYGNTTGQTSVVDACLPCPVGSYCIGGANITACTSGQYCPANSSTSVICAFGQYCTNATITADCPAGSWSDTTGLVAASQCTPCLAGKYGSTSGQTSVANGCPFNCTAGQYCPAGSSLSSPCPAGSYCTNSSTLSLCPSGSWSSSNGLISATSCTQCVAGTYGNVPGQSSIGTACPFTCAAGSYGNTTGQTSVASACLPCPIGSYCTGGANITACSLGQYCPSNSSIATVCAVGQYCTNATITADCPAGSWSKTTGLIAASQCTSCQTGTYGSSSGQKSAATGCPFTCIAGTYGNATGQATASGACASCPMGSYCTGGVNVTACSAGRYSSDTNLSSAASCTQCAAGTFGNTTGQTTAVAACPSSCPAGRFGNITGQITASGACFSCPAGNYCTGGANITSCPAGTYSNMTNLASASSCTKCSIGTYGNHAGQTAAAAACPFSCAAGSYGTTVGQTTMALACVSCPPGSYCIGGANIANCSAGMYSNTSNLPSASSCTQCAAGTYGNVSGQTTAAIACSSSCAAGSYGIIAGQTTAASACLVCPAGSYCTGGGNLANCTAGTYSINAGLLSQSQCLACPLNAYCTGGRSNVTCALGTYNPSNGGTSSTACKADCTMPSSLPIGIGVGNCTIPGRMHAGDGCVLEVLPTYALANGSLFVTCPITGSPLNYSVPTTMGAPCSISVPAGRNLTIGNCPASLASGQSCQFGCQSGLVNNDTRSVYTTCGGGTLIKTQQCIPCSLGNYVAGTVCAPCPAGNTCADPMLLPVPCGPGQYCPIGSSASTLCAIGQYCTNSSVTEACPAGSWSNRTALTASSQCTQCVAGTYGSAANQTSSASACQLCPAGSYCGGGANISVCAPGMYSINISLTSQSQCSTCPQNHYCGNGTATMCLSGSFFTGTGATASSSCLADCSPTTTTLAMGVAAGNCSQGGALHAGQSCLLALQTNYTLTGGSLVIRCLINSTLSYSPPTAVGFPCPVSTPLNADPGNCSSILLSSAICVLLPAPGFTLASGSLTLVCSLGQLSAYPTLAPTILPPLVTFVDPPSAFQLGSGLLELQATTTTSATSASLQYTWSYISVADQAMGIQPTFLPASSSPQLQLDPSLLLPDTTYNFSVRVVDTSQADGSGVAPRSVTSTSVHVFLATQQVQSAAGVDPCSSNPSFQCLNGGRCLATAIIPGSLNYTLTCACSTNPILFLGANCDFALLECPNGNVLYSGGADIALYGIGFNTLRRIAVAGRAVQFQNDADFNSSSRGAEWQGVLSRWPSYADRVQRVRFIAPALVTVNQTASSTSRLLSSTSTGGTNAAALINPPAAYQMLTLSSLLLADGSGSGKLLEANVSNILYYSSSACRNAGQWKEDGAGGCLPCPEGAFWSVCFAKLVLGIVWLFFVYISLIPLRSCFSLSSHSPGAGRAWPLPRYWSAKLSAPCT